MRGLLKILFLLLFLAALAGGGFIAVCHYFGNPLDAPPDPGFESLMAGPAMPAPDAACTAAMAALDAAPAFVRAAGEKCWTDAPGDASFCLGPDAAARARADNAALLAAYAAAAAQCPAPAGMKLRPDLIDVNHVLAASWVARTRAGDGAAALDEWLAVNDFMHRALAQPGIDTAARMIVLVNTRIVLDALPAMLAAAPALAAERGAALDAALTRAAFGPGGWPLTDTVRADYALARNVLAEYESAAGIAGLKVAALYLPHETRAAIRRHYDRMTRYETMDAVTFVRDHSTAGSADDYVHNTHPLINPLGKIALMAFSEPRDIITAPHVLDAERRLLRLYAQAKAANVLPAAAASFAAQQPAGLHDPFTAAPFGWNGEYGVYFFTFPGDDGARCRTLSYATGRMSGTCPGAAAPAAGAP